MIGYLDKVIRPLALVLLEMSGYVKTFKVEDGDRDRKDKLMSLCINDDKLFKKYKTVWTKIEVMLNIKLNALLVYDDRYIKTEMRAYGDNVCANVRG